MRIVHLLSQTHLTGAEVHALTLAAEMAGPHDELLIISDSLHAPTSAEFIARPIHHARGWKRWREIIFLRRLIRERKIDIIHAHSRAAVRIGWWATRGTSAALVSTIHGRQPPSPGKRFFDQYGERVLVVCAELKKQLMRELGMADERLRVLGNPVPMSERPSPRDPTKPWLLATRWTGPKGERAREFLKQVAIPALRADPSRTLVIAAPPPENEPTLAKDWAQWKNEFGPRLGSLGTVGQLEKNLSPYSLIFGGGRVAIAALLEGVPVIAFGEAATCGWVSSTDYEAARASNFGDMMDQSVSTPIEAARIRADLSRALAAREDELQALRERARRDFSATWVAREVRAVYQSALALRHHPRPIPILMYHQVTAQPLETRHRIFVTRERFREHLALFLRTGHTTLTFGDLLDFKEGRRPWSEFPKKPLVLTFDDGYRNNLEYAAPLLYEHAMKAVIFLLCDPNLKHNSWDAGEVPESPLMNEAERKRLRATGVFEVASHGFSHQKMTEMTEAEARHELTASKARLEAEFGRPVHAFAFTYGAVDERCPELAREAGYAYALNTDRGALRLEDDPHRVFRINVFPEDSGAQLRKKISWWYRYRYRWTRGV